MRSAGSNVAPVNFGQRYSMYLLDSRQFSFFSFGGGQCCVVRKEYGSGAEV